MATVRKNVALSFSLLTATVNVLSALIPKERNVTVCIGAGGKPEHAPIRVSQKTTCTQCGDIQYDEIRKARVVPEGLVLLTDEDLASVTVDASEWKAKMAMTPHPAAAVEVDTAPGGKAYYLEPVTGHEQNYRVLVHLVEKHPELAFCTRWTPRSSMSVYRLTVRDNALLMQERVAGDKVQPAPPLAPVEVPEALLGMAEQVLALDGVIADFDLASYKDSAEDKLAAIIASRTAQVEIPRDGAPGTAPAPVKDALSALQEMLNAAQAPAQAPAKKTTRKKATAKKGS